MIATTEPARPSAPLTNPGLGATLRAEYEALQNDVEQANELAAEFQRQLAGKSNEVAEFRQLFEKTQKDLTRLQASITELREERHRLANEAMRAAAFERKLAQMTGERDRLLAELDLTKQAVASGADESRRCVLDRDAQIARLLMELTELREKNPASRAPASARRSGGNDAAVKGVLSEMWRTLEQLQTILDPQSPAAKPKAQAAAKEEFIDIAFDR